MLFAMYGWTSCHDIEIFGWSAGVSILSTANDILFQQKLKLVIRPVTLVNRSTYLVEVFTAYVYILSPLNHNKLFYFKFIVFLTNQS